MRLATRARRLWLAALSATVILMLLPGGAAGASASAATLPIMQTGSMQGTGTPVRPSASSPPASSPSAPQSSKAQSSKARRSAPQPTGQASVPQAATPPSDAKCEFFNWAECTSLNTDVSIDTFSDGDTSDCTFTTTTDWGDGTSPTSVDFNGGPDGTMWDVGDHTYTTPGTYAISVDGVVDSGDCGYGASAYTFTLTCEQSTQADGSYEFGGCVTPEDDDSQDVTIAASNLDGIGVSASPSDMVTYDDGGTDGNELTAADSTLSLDVDGTPIPIFDGPVSDSLTAPISVAAPAKLAGLGLSGQLSLTPGSGGSLTATATATLPPQFGGGTGKLTATSTVNKGLTKAVVTLDKASFLQLFTLSNLSLTWTSGSGGETWKVAATASAGGKKTGKLTGSLTYEDDTLTAADLSVTGLSLAGLADLSALTVTYGGDGWQGTATLGSGASAATANVSLAFDDTGLASATISAANMSLFGVLKVQDFTLSYGGGTWSIEATGAGGGGVSGSMTVTDGAISVARLTATKLSFLGKFTIENASVSYAAQAPNDQCADVQGDSIWCGAWTVELPSATVVDGVSGTLAAADGSFASGSVDVTGNVPLLDGVILTKLGGRVTVNPPPTTIAGTVGLRFGPKVRGLSLIDLSGTLTRQLPGDDTSGSYDLDGSVNVLSVLHGTAKVTVPGDGSGTTFDLTANAAVTGASAVGELTGSFTSDSLTLAGDVNIQVLGHKVSGTMKADANGMAACGQYRGYKAGFEYDWNTASTSFLGTKGCSEAGF